MSQTEKGLGNSQTLCVELSELCYETMEQLDGRATVIRFQVRNQAVRHGDVLLVLEGPEIRFHGLIGQIEEGGWAVAVDRRGSTIPVVVA
jgi:hypothetical protein